MGPNPQEIADLVTFTGEILNGKLHFLCSGLIKLSTNHAHIRFIASYANKITFTKFSSSNLCQID